MRLLLCRSRALLASYVVSQRVLADWWQPYYRDEVYKRAKTRLTAALQHDNSLRNAVDDDGDDNDASDEAVTARSSSAAAGASAAMHAGDADMYGDTDELRSDDVTSSDADGDDATLRASASAATATQPSGWLSLYEANALLATFVTHHDGESASAVLQYVRDRLREPLCPFHYHALLRIFAMQRDKDSAVQLLELMTAQQQQQQQDGDDGDDARATPSTTTIVTLETYARVLDCLHCLAPRDALRRALQLCEAAQRVYGTLVYVIAPGSESATAAALAASAPQVHNKSNDNDNNNDNDDNDDKAERLRYCPVLTSLLHHVSQHVEGGPVAAMVVVVWMRALGVTLGDWDYVLLLSALLSRRASFPLLRALFGSVGDEAALGTTTPHAVCERVLGSRHTATATTATTTTTQAATTTTQSATTAATTVNDAPSTSSVCSLHVPLSARRVAEAMRTSLLRAGVDMHTPVHVGVVNTRTLSLDALVDRVLTLAEATAYDKSASRKKEKTDNEKSNKNNNSKDDDCDNVRVGLGPHGYNVAVLHHTLTLLHSALHDSTSAVRALQRAADVEARVRAMLQAHNGNSNNNNNSSSSDKDNNSSDVADETSSSCAMRVHVHHLVDTATLLPSVSRCTAAAVLPVYASRVPRLLQQAAARAKRLRASANNNNNNNNSNNNNSNNSNNNDNTAMFATESLWSEATGTSTMDAVACAGVLTAHVRRNADARAALQRAMASVQQHAGKPRLSSTSRALFRHVAQLCVHHPRRNCKLTATGLEERRKWGVYLDARDTALALLGSTRQARDSMKHLFYSDNRLPELRSRAMVARDVADVCQLFWPDAEATSNNSNSNTHSDNDSATLLSPSSSRLQLQQQLLQRRTTLPRLHCAADVVPRHLWDAAVYNPYPHIYLLHGSARCSNDHGSSPDDDDDGDSDSITDDVFADLWRALMDRHVMRDTTWYLQHADMYMLLMRGLLYRLDWEAAVHLTTKMQEQMTYTYYMDNELHSIFRDIGDPAGFLAFKVATRLFDGRILHHGTASARDAAAADKDT